MFYVVSEGSFGQMEMLYMKVLSWHCLLDSRDFLVALYFLMLLCIDRRKLPVQKDLTVKEKALYYCSISNMNSRNSDYK